MFAVQMKNISKSFGSLKANDSIHLNVRKGEIHAVVGENGAGKTTLMKILYGMYSPGSGEIYINGQREMINSPAKAIQLGIGMVHQHFMLVKAMTVIENIILGDEQTKRFNLVDFSFSAKKINELQSSFSFKINLNDKVADLSIGLEQRVEILKTLYRDADILILDEPTAVLTPQETDELFSILKNLSGKGKSVILITHKLNEVMSVSDSVTVLRHGKVVGEAETKNTTKEELAELIIGRKLESFQNRKKTLSDKTVLEISGLNVPDDRGITAVRNVSFSIKGGEIFGIAGVEGNGQKQLAEAVTLIRPVQSGTIKIYRKQIDKQTVKTQSIAHIPEDRQESGLVLQLSVSKNMILGRQRERQFSTFYNINENIVKKFSEELIKKYNIHPQNSELVLHNMSGGNQQKVILSRELSKDAGLIVMNQPTRGLDISASEFIHRSILQQRDNGNAVLLISSDLSELLKLSDRIAVMYNGEFAAVLDAENTGEHEIGLYMTGGHKTF